MPERISRVLMMVEMTVILLPLMLFGLMTLFLFVGQSPISLLFLLLLVMNLALLCGFRLALEFASGGTAKLATLSPLWWVGAAVGLLYVLPSYLAPYMTLVPHSVSMWFDFGVFGVPVLIPALHLLAERFLRPIKPSAA